MSFSNSVLALITQSTGLRNRNMKTVTCERVLLVRAAGVTVIENVNVKLYVTYGKTAASPIL